VKVFEIKVSYFEFQLSYWILFFVLEAEFRILTDSRFLCRASFRDGIVW